MPPKSIKLMIREEEVLGEMPLAPSALTGVSEAQLAQAVSLRVLKRSTQPEISRRPGGSKRLAAVAALIRR